MSGFGHHYNPDELWKKVDGKRREEVGNYERI